MKTLGALLLIAVLGFFCQSCTKHTTEPSPSPDPPGSTPGDLTETEKALIESTNRFGLKLFKEIAAAEAADQNIFISPLSVSFALGMTYNGADHETREAMAATLELSGMTVEEINQSYRNVIDLLTNLDPAVVFKIANSIWYRDGFPIAPEFIQLNQEYFDAEVRGLDFAQIWAADTINHWVDFNTEGKITEIIKPPIPEAVVMYLINALYFNGNWTLPFDTGSTADLPFFFPDGSMDKRPMMQTDTLLPYFGNDLFQAVDLPYGDKTFNMAILVPSIGHSVDEIIAQLDDNTWAGWMNEFAVTEVKLGLPKFKFGYEIMLNDILKAMGMSIAFDQVNADFGNMVVDINQLWGNLFISFVKHKTFIQVDEEGTEAAAVTIVGIELTSVGPPAVYANRPFLFVIHERESGSILFMGKIVDPVWED